LPALRLLPDGTTITRLHPGLAFAGPKRCKMPCCLPVGLFLCLASCMSVFHAVAMPAGQEASRGTWAHGLAPRPNAFQHAHAQAVARLIRASQEQRREAVAALSARGSFLRSPSGSDLLSRRALCPTTTLCACP
jgi:hypothetical protein